MGIWEKVSRENGYVQDNLNSSDLQRSQQFSLMLKKMLVDSQTYSVGFHQIGWHGVQNEEIPIVNSFLEKGISTIRQGEQGGVLQVVAMLGNSNIAQKIDVSVDRFYYMSKVEERTGACIVAIPEYLRGFDGKKYLLGKFSDDLEHSERDTHNHDEPISILFNKTGNLPPEFILGIITRNSEGEVCLDANENFISNLSENEQSTLLDQYFQKGLPQQEMPEILNIETAVRRALKDGVTSKDVREATQQNTRDERSEEYEQ